MIKTIIKHKLLETAINNLFNTVIHNFQDYKGLSHFAIGDRYKYIDVCYHDTCEFRMYEVYIRNIQYRNDQNYIYVSYRNVHNFQLYRSINTKVIINLAK